LDIARNRNANLSSPPLFVVGVLGWFLGSVRLLAEGAQKGAPRDWFIFRGGLRLARPLKVSRSIILSMVVKLLISLPGMKFKGPS